MTTFSNPFAALLARSRNQAGSPAPQAERSAPGASRPTPPLVAAAANGDAVIAAAEATAASTGVAPTPLLTDELPGLPATEHAEPAVANPDLTKMHILVSAGSAQANMILAGTVGTVDEQGEFKIDPDYRSLAYLFTLAGGSGVPGMKSDENTVVALDVHKDLVPVAKANLIEVAARGWSAMYDSVGSNMPGGAMARTMLEQEKANVQGAVADYLQAKALPQWDVPVSYRAMVYEEDPSQRSSDVAGLLAQSSAYTTQIDIDATRLVIAHVEPEERPAVEPQQIPQDWAEHKGELDLLVGATLTVRAPDEQSAADVAQTLLAAGKHARQIQRHLVPQPKLILSAQLCAPSDDDSDYDRDNG